MKNKFIILVLFLIAFSLIYQNSGNITGDSIYFTGDSFESGGKIITIRKISQTNVVIDVDGIKNIINIKEKKTINDVEIEVLDLFYTDELESRNVDITINVILAVEPEIVEEEEVEVEGKKDECKKHEDCNDGDFRTEDVCVDLNPKICKHYIVGEETDDIVIEDETEEVEEEEEELIETLGFFSRLASFFKNLF